MPRPVTLFTGQWADLSLPDLATKAAQMGYDGLELACWGDHFDVDKAAVSKKYCKERWEILSDHGLTSFAISSHLVGQAVCDLIDERGINQSFLLMYGAREIRRKVRNGLPKNWPRQPRRAEILSTKNPAEKRKMIFPLL